MTPESFTMHSEYPRPHGYVLRDFRAYPFFPQKNAFIIRSPALELKILFAWRIFAVKKVDIKLSIGNRRWTERNEICSLFALSG